MSVLPDHATALNVASQRSKTRGDVSAPADRLFRLDCAKHGHGRLGTDPVGVAVDVAIEDQIADQQDSPAAEGVYPFCEFVRHERLSISRCTVAPRILRRQKGSIVRPRLGRGQ